MKTILGIFAFVVWCYILRVLKKGNLKFWHYMWGSCGLFVLMMMYVRPILTQPLARIVTALTGILGNFLGCYSAYFKYGVIFVTSGEETISLLVDFECSGILEIMAFVSLFAFFEVYTKIEKIIVGTLSIAALIFGNAFRISLICVIIHFFGVSSYYVAHSFIGRIVFYIISVVIYFHVFTKSQIIRQKVGGFAYEVST